MIEISNYDKAVIIVGDEDYACLVEYLLNQNKLEKLIIPDIKKYSFLLTRFPKYTVFMNNLKSKLEYKKNDIITLHRLKRLHIDIMLISLIYFILYIVPCMWASGWLLVNSLRCFAGFNIRISHFKILINNFNIILKIIPK